MSFGFFLKKCFFLTSFGKFRVLSHIAYNFKNLNVFGFYASDYVHLNSKSTNIWDTVLGYWDTLIYYPKLSFLKAM